MDLEPHKQPVVLGHRHRSAADSRSGRVRDQGAVLARFGEFGSSETGRGFFMAD